MLLLLLVIAITFGSVSGTDVESNVYNNLIKFINTSNFGRRNIPIYNSTYFDCQCMQYSTYDEYMRCWNYIDKCEWFQGCNYSNKTDREKCILRFSDFRTVYFRIKNMTTIVNQLNATSILKAKMIYWSNMNNINQINFIKDKLPRDVSKHIVCTIVSERILNGLTVDEFTIDLVCQMPLKNQIDYLLVVANFPADILHNLF